MNGTTDELNDRAVGSLRGQTALVTAGARGIGRACAERLHAEGARVVVVDVDTTALNGAAFESFEMDVCNALALSELSKRIGLVSTLVNCVGIVDPGTVLDCSEEDWQRTFNVNVGSMFLSIKTFLPGMLECRRGSIINMSSVVSSVKGARERFAYGASKAAVIGLTKSVAADYILDGIRCNAICPGTTESPSLYDRIRQQAASEDVSVEDVLSWFIARQPMGRLGRPAEIAALASFLAHDDAAFITGQTLQIDGGWTL